MVPELKNLINRVFPDPKGCAVSILKGIIIRRLRKNLEITIKDLLEEFKHSILEAEVLQNA